MLASPYYFWRLRRRGNWQTGFGERFARYSPDLKQALTNRHIVWIHAVSVGEVNLCTQIIRALEPRVPNVKFVVSTTTTTGMGELKRRLPSHVSKIYYPIDRAKFVARAFGVINPLAVVLVEAEIWPNFIWRAQKLGIPLFLANARLSDRSFPRYKRFRFLFRPLFAAFSGVGAQNKEDAERLLEVGCRPDAVRIVGNLKFDASKLDERRTLDVPALLKKIGVAESAPILVCGSTHDGEEMMFAGIARRLRAQFPDLFLILVPRHFERCREIGQKLKQAGLKFVYRTELDVNHGNDDKLSTLVGTRFSTENSQNDKADLDCLLVNTTGELRFFYEYASVVFVGKSMTAIGGQNPIEPGALGKAIVFGPNMQNFADITKSFLRHGAAVQVHSPEELEKTIGELLSDKSRRAELGRHALEVVAENLGAVERTAEMILEHLKPQGIYIAPKK